MRHQVSERIGPMVNAAIDRHAMGERVLWEPQLMPGQQGEAMLVCFFWIPGVTLGSTMQGSFPILDPLGITPETVDDLVEEFLRRFREAKSEALSGLTPTEPAQEVLRGQQRASGLIIG